MLSTVWPAGPGPAPGSVQDVLMYCELWPSADDDVEAPAAELHAAAVFSEYCLGMQA